MPVRTLSRDTSPEAQRLLLERWRSMSGGEKARLVDRLFRDCERLALAGIRIQRPGLDPRQVRLLLAVRRLGRALTREAFGPDPIVER